MDYHSKTGTVFMVQIDHLTGEQIGYAVGRLYDAGASNVQVISSVTKKNRPSYVIFIDCRSEYAASVEAVIPDDLGAGGWHVLTTEHRYLYNRAVIKRITAVSSRSGRSAEVEIRGKLFENGNLRPEHESVTDLQERVQGSMGIFLRYTEAYNIIMDCLMSENDSITIAIN